MGWREEGDRRRQTDATVVPFQDANNEPDGLKVMSAVLQANPDLTIAIGTNDDVARGMATRLQGGGKGPREDLHRRLRRGPNRTSGRSRRALATSSLPPAISLIDLADLLVEKNIEFALNGPPSGPPQNFDMPVFAIMKGDPKLDEFLAKFELMN